MARARVHVAQPDLLGGERLMRLAPGHIAARTVRFARSRARPTLAVVKSGTRVARPSRRQEFPADRAIAATECPHSAANAAVARVAFGRAVDIANAAFAKPFPPDHANASSGCSEIGH